MISNKPVINTWPALSPALFSRKACMNFFLQNRCLPVDTERLAAWTKSGSNEMLINSELLDST